MNDTSLLLLRNKASLLLRNKYILLIIILLIGGFLRFFNLRYFPVQLNHDEVSQLYDAISIAQTGRDIYGNFLPTMFQSVNDFKSPFYTYITSLFYLFLGGGELTIKLPGAIFGWLIIIAVYLFVNRLFNNWMLAITAAFFTAIAPFEVFFSRKSFENVAGILFMLLGFTSLLVYVNTKHNFKSLYSGIIFLAIAIYTYFSHAVIIPLLLLLFLFIYKGHFLKINKKLLLGALLFLSLLIPLFIITITNPDARYRSQSVFITQDINLGRNIEYSRSSDVITSLLLKNEGQAFLLRNKAILDFAFSRYLAQFNIDFIFQSGLDFTNQGPLNQGILLLIQLPFLILGIIYLTRLEGFKKEKLFILTWILLGILPSGLTFEEHSPHRSIMVFTMLNIISAIGFYYVVRLIKNFYLKNTILLSGTIWAILTIAFVLNYIFFIHMYFVNFPFEKSQAIHYPFKQVAEFAWENHDGVEQIIFDPLYGETAPVVGTASYYYLAYYGKYPPDKFQREYRLGDKEREVLFDKFSIRKIDWRDDQYLQKTLIIGSGWSLPINSIDKSKIIKIFYFYNGQPAFYAVKL